MIDNNGADKVRAIEFQVGGELLDGSGAEDRAMCIPGRFEVERLETPVM